MILEVAGLNVHFQAFGSGTPLLIVHGWGDSSASWSAVAQLLSPHFQVFLLDLPGFGGSDTPPCAWTVAEYTQVLSAFIEELELDSVIIVGHSHGGKIACEYAASSNAKAAALVLIASSGMDVPSYEVRAKILLFKLAKYFLLRCGGWGKQQLERLRGRMGSRDYREAGVLRDTMVRVVNHKLFQTLPKIHIPVLILWGSKDQTLPLEQAKEFRKSLSNSYIRVLWDATHHPHLEQPAEIANYIIDFAAEGVS